MSREQVVIVVVIVAPLLLFFGRRSMWFDVYGAYAPETHAAVVRIAPVGTAILDAKHSMEWRGFSCSSLQHRRYAGDNLGDVRKPKIQYPAADIVACRASRWLPDFFPKVWGVIFAYGGDNNTVSNIAVSVDWDGL